MLHRRGVEFYVVVTPYCAIKLKHVNSLSIRPRFLTPHEEHFLLIYMSVKMNTVCWGIYRSSERQVTEKVCPSSLLSETKFVEAREERILRRCTYLIHKNEMVKC
jgi:tRNA A37 threonylcarbamoyladenosine modification protein TsaB